MQVERNFRPMISNKSIAQMLQIIKKVSTINSKSFVGLDDYFNASTENPVHHRVDCKVEHNNNTFEVQMVEINDKVKSAYKFSSHQKFALKILDSVYDRADKKIKTLFFIRDCGHKNFDFTTPINTEFSLINDICNEIEDMCDEENTTDISTNLLPIIIQLNQQLNLIPIHTTC